MELKIEYVNVDDITLYNKNAREHTDRDVDIIATSIRKYGFNDAIGIWGRKNIVVEGHGRLLAAKKIGMKTVPCVRLDHLTDKERREYAIAHNRSAELSEWDFDILNEETEDLDFDDFDYGFDFADLEAELKGENQPAEKDDAPLDLDAGGGDTQKSVMHCPKCGFEFEV